MTTNNEQNETRPLGELLALKTYQDMTDEEIEMVINWRESNAYSRGNSDALNSQAMMNVLDHKRKNDALSKQIESMIKSMQQEIESKYGAKESCNE